MAEFNFRHALTTTATMELDESELRALDALAGYGDDAFLKMFYDKLGSSYMKPHEKGLIKLFANIRGNVGQPLRDVESARKLLAKAEQERRERLEERLAGK